MLAFLTCGRSVENEHAILLLLCKFGRHGGQNILVRWLGWSLFSSVWGQSCRKNFQGTEIQQNEACDEVLGLSFNFVRKHHRGPFVGRHALAKAAYWICVFLTQPFNNHTTCLVIMGQCAMIIGHVLWSKYMYYLITQDTSQARSTCLLIMRHLLCL